MKHSVYAPDIAFCIKELESTPDQQFSLLEGSEVGHTIVMVWRSPDPDKVGQCYEVRIAKIEETYQIEPEHVEAELIGDDEGQS